MKNNLAVFAPTADQRFLLGEELFLRTHFPMTMRRYDANGEVSQVTEEQLLTQVLAHRDSAPGNRIWILYGAPGSGKSELVKWVETRVAQAAPQRHALTVRVTREQLDVLSITNAFLELLPADFLSEVTSERWRMARQKTRTLTKIILLFALENLLDSDELINALFYRLLNAIHPYVARVLQAEETGESEGESMELIGQETWETILAETALAVPIEYEQFRYQLTVAFQDHLLEGLSLADTMGRISAHLRATSGVRPLLLVDDLVQSLNLFATDILDYLLTLEAGNWDVVLGLTPAAFENSQRGRALLQRITYLDTIDDRVEKLWLSDETGQESYVLTEDTCPDFARRYLEAYSGSSQGEGAPFPLRRELFVRMYRAVPAGKGKARYVVRYLREILRRLQEGEDPLAVLPAYTETEYVARTPNRRLARVCELYGPLLQAGSDHHVVLDDQLLRAFQLTAEAQRVAIEPVVKFYTPQASAVEVIGDEGKAAVRDWLVGREVNRQLLKRLRQGAARWLRTLEPPTRIYRDHVSRPRGILRWRQAYLGIKPPLCVEGVDDSAEVEGIALTRELGVVAFDLHQYATAKGARRKAVKAKLANAPQLLSLHAAAVAFRRSLFVQLARQTTMAVDELALSLFVFLLFVKPSLSERPPGFRSEFWREVTRDRRQRAAWRMQLAADLLDDIESLFTDFYRLRANVYDGHRIATHLGDRSADEVLEGLLAIETASVSPYYRLGRRPLGEALSAVQQMVETWLFHPEQEQLSEAAADVLARLQADTTTGVPLEEVPDEVWRELRTVSPEIYARLRVSLRG